MSLQTLLFSALFLSSQALGAQDDAWQKRWYTSDGRLNRAIGGLDDQAQDEFTIGRSFFSIPWVVAPSATTARDGLGPLFNANTCTSCHRGNGLGELYNAKGQISRAMVSKLTRKSGLPVPHYGHQIAVNGTVKVPFEAMPTRTYTPVTVTYPDGRKVVLQQPTYGLTHLNYGELPDDVIIVQRRAPALVGLGLLSQVSTQTLLDNADPDDRDGDGISGRPNWVTDAAGKKRLGRFTAKAGVATVRQQSADAAVNDMGLTNPVFPHEQCTATQTACQQAPRGRPDYRGISLDLTEARLAAMTSFLKHTRVPVKPLDQMGERGKQLFQSVGCSRCHLPALETADGKVFSPYSDLLLHDMGEGLADGRQEFSATGREFRTAPLWGLSSYGKTLKSKRPHYLHDGRANSVEEAILWHGGEAEGVKNTFMQLPATDRQAIFSFLQQL